MKSEELRNLQAPLKDKYRKQPESATITLKAEGKISEGISCKVETGRLMAEAGVLIADVIREAYFLSPA